MTAITIPLPSRHSALLALSAGLVLVSFIWQGRHGFQLADESFLWYGAQRVLVGEVPIRDFMSYDPGRYYWSAGVMAVLGDNGIMALRAGVAVFQAVGLFVALLVLDRHEPRSGASFLLVAAAVLFVWMWPRHKLFDVTLSIALVATLAALIESPSRRRLFLAGIAVGLIAGFGRNHGLYGVVGSIGTIVYASVGRGGARAITRDAFTWGSGVAAGYVPMLALVSLIPGVWPAFWEDVRYLFERGATNISLPVPWPWIALSGNATPLETVRSMLVGTFFILVPAFGLVGIAQSTWRRVRGADVPPLVVASSIMSLPYAHYAYSRADLGHLALGIFPLLVGLLAVLSKAHSVVKWPLVIALAGASLVVMVPAHPGWSCRYLQPCTDQFVGRDTLRIPRDLAENVALIRTLADRFAPGGRPFLVVPFWPGGYAILERKAPLWSIYPLLPRGGNFQQREIERLKASKPGFALVVDWALDGREELKFENTHPLVDRYLRENFERVEGVTANDAFRVYRSR